jgi:hypothetical protein
MSCGLPTRSVGPTDRSAGLLVGRTHFSGTAVSLVGGDPEVPMSHTRGGYPYSEKNPTINGLRPWLRIVRSGRAISSGAPRATWAM